jgi:hypothetical protein
MIKEFFCSFFNKTEKEIAFLSLKIMLLPTFFDLLLSFEQTVWFQVSNDFLS